MHNQEGLGETLNHIHGHVTPMTLQQKNNKFTEFQVIFFAECNFCAVMCPDMYKYELVFNTNMQGGPKVGLQFTFMDIYLVSKSFFSLHFRSLWPSHIGQNYSRPDSLKCFLFFRKILTQKGFEKAKSYSIEIKTITHALASYAKVHFKCQSAKTAVTFEALQSKLTTQKTRRVDAFSLCLSRVATVKNKRFSWKKFLKQIPQLLCEISQRSESFCPSQRHITFLHG